MFAPLKKDLVLASISLALVALSGCGSGSTSPVTINNPTSTTFTLSVVNGYGSGTYAAGTSVDVFANPAATNAAFMTWTGSTANMIDANSYHTTVTGTAGSTLTVTANYTLGIPSLVPTSVSVPGTDTGTSANRVTTPTVPASPISIGYVVPASHPKGIIFEFHGSTGRYIDFFAQIDNVAFNAQALAAGYGVVAVNSAASTGYWDYKTLYPSNLDFQNIQATETYLIGLGVMSVNDKIYGIGVSDGGYFASSVARALAFKAVSLNISAGLALYYDPTTNVPTINGISHTLVPSIIEMAQQDGTSGVPNGGLYPAVIGIGAAGIEQGYCNATELQTLASPVPACNTSITPNPYIISSPDINFFMNPPSPAYPARFAQVPGISAATAAAIDTWMQSKGCIDANGRILINPYQSVDYNASPVNFLCSRTPLAAQFSGSITSQQAEQLNEEFLIAYAEHHFMAEFNARILTFFAAH